MIKECIIKQAIVFVFAVFCGCTPEKQTSPVFPYSETVGVQPVENPPFVGLPVALEYFNGRIFISEYHSDTLVTEFDVEKAEVVSRSIIKGAGPNDALPPLGLFLSGDTLFFLNRRTFSLGYDILDVSGECRMLTFHKICSFPTEISNLTAIDGRYLAAGYFNDGRYAVFNSRGEKEREFGDYPSFLFGEKDFPASAKAMYHQVSFATNRRLRRVACVSSHVLDLVDFSTSARVLRRIQLDSYNYRFATGDFITSERTDDTSVGARAVSSTDESIYILFNSSTNAGSDPVNEIWRFDWEGEPVQKFLVNHAIVELKAVNDSILYSFSLPEYELVKLNIGVP
ncbi:MAG: TolB-like 6-bladed beta-propeller domain-containing protein [Tannerella sp.]|jgi:hypothetical protein|nr:TolB-like 6-bladed beta-propeller domain-containing protein [Tannerella sp.]